MVKHKIRGSDDTAEWYLEDDDAGLFDLWVTYRGEDYNVLGLTRDGDFALQCLDAKDVPFLKLNSCGEVKTT